MNPLELSGPLPLGRTHIARADHFVHFYENKEFLLDALRSWSALKLNSGRRLLIWSGSMI
jgi:hypothetical protein